MKKLIIACLLGLAVTTAYAQNYYNNNRNTQQRSGYTFYNHAAVYGYIMGRTWKNQSTVVSIEQNGIFVNGNCVSGAVTVERFNATSALISAYIFGSQQAFFLIDLSNNSLTEADGTVYFTR